MISTSSSPSFSLRTKIPPLEEFFKDFSSRAPVGPSLRYRSLYDEVRLARQEDDHRLSMGIWQRELKRAEWNKVETLCVEALLKISKDLQIAAWLTEAWTCLDGIQGYSRGINLLTGLSEQFWHNLHPQLPEDGDLESRYLIFEWLDTTLSQRLLVTPLTQSKLAQTALSLAFLKSAQHAEAAQKRVKNANIPSAKTDSSKTSGTIEEFYKSLEQTPDSHLIHHQKNLELAKTATITLKNTLMPLLGNMALSFSQLLNTIKDMEHLINTTLQRRKPLEPPHETTTTPLDVDACPTIEDESHVLQALPLAQAALMQLKTRDDAYHQLDIIASFLEQNDPHSLAPQLMRQLIRWQNKNILDIFEEIASSPQEFDMLTKILGTTPHKKQ